MTTRRVVRIVAIAALVGLATWFVVNLWPNVEAILTFGALFAILGGYMALTSWAQRRRRRGDEAGTTNAEGAEGMTFGGWG